MFKFKALSHGHLFSHFPTAVIYFIYVVLLMHFPVICMFAKQARVNGELIPLYIDISHMK